MDLENQIELEQLPYNLEAEQSVLGGLILDPSYMADALKASECEKLKIEMNGPISPMKLVPVDDDSFLFLVLPVRLKS